MGWFFKKKLGFEPLKNLERATITNNVAHSNLIGYDFTLPENFAFVDTTASGNSVDEFKAMSTDGNIMISVLITLMDEATGKEVKKTWEKTKPTVAGAILSRTYEDFDPDRTDYDYFLGLDCIHYDGYINNSQRGNKRFRSEKYIYLSPYATINFDVMYVDSYKDMTIGLFDSFKKI